MSRWVRSAALISLIAALHGCGSSWTSGRVDVSTARIPVSFRTELLEATRVCVAGSFNGWSSSASCMHREGDRWSLELFLEPGRYVYVFVVDDRLWVPDALAPLRDDSGFGQLNSVLIVE